MNNFPIAMAGFLVIAGTFLIWLYTKSGKKWLENL